MPTPHYDRIAKKWHEVTGSQGGAVKRHVLNDLVMDRVTGVAGVAILELGAGNGYFLPLVFRRFSGQVPARVVITDQSPRLLELAQRHFGLPEAEYLVLDVREPFPGGDGEFGLIIANMLFNELTAGAFRRALGECRRVLGPTGKLLATVTHPALVAGLRRRGELKPLAGPVLTMPGADGLRLPVVPRGVPGYVSALEAAGFRVALQDVYPTDEVLAAKPGLRKAGKVPVALLMDCEPAGGGA